MTGNTVDRGPQPWVDLWEAMRIIVRLGDNGERFASIMTAPTWAMFDHPTSVEAHYGPEWVALFPVAKKAFLDACDLLTGVLKCGLVVGEGRLFGEGVNGAPGQRRTIKSSEWGNRYIDIASSELRPLIGDRPDDFPVLRTVRVSADDVRRACLGEIAARMNDGAAAAIKSERDEHVVEEQADMIEGKGIAPRPTKPEAISIFLRESF